MKNFDLRKYLAENKLLKETIDFPEMEDEFNTIVDEEDYLQSIINASPEEIVSDNYYEIMNAVEQGRYSAEEAAKLAKDWAREKLSGLSKNNPVNKGYQPSLEDEKPYLDGLSLKKLYDIKNRIEKKGNPFEIENEVHAYINSRIEKLESQQEYYNSKIGIWQYGVNKLSPEDLNILVAAQKSGKISNKVGTRMSEPDMIISYNSGDTDIENLLKSIEKDPDYS
jgi:hypothetical protein